MHRAHLPLEHLQPVGCLARKNVARTTVDAHDACRVPNNRRIFGHVSQHHRLRTDFGIVTDINIAKRGAALTDHHIIAQLRMSFSILLAGRAERCVVQEGATESDASGRTNNDSSGVVNH